MSTKQESKTTVSHLPEHGPIDENGREILLQVKNVDITFGKGDDAVKAVKNLLLTSTRERPSPS